MLLIQCESVQHELFLGSKPSRLLFVSDSDSKVPRSHAEVVCRTKVVSQTKVSAATAAKQTYRFNCYFIWPSLTLLSSHSYSAVPKASTCTRYSCIQWIASAKNPYRIGFKTTSELLLIEVNLLKPGICYTKGYLQAAHRT